MEWITCEDTYEESWRRLLEFANLDIAFEHIEKLHGKANNKTKSLYTKQSKQIRVCLLQAKEYFEAAKNSSLFTQPNHLYYGAVSLTTALMLIKGDGEHSLDFLRRDGKNSHHGLDFTFSSDIKTSQEGLKLLENSYIKICPNGQFKNWYRTLTAKQPVYALNIKNKSRSQTTGYDIIGSFNILNFDDLINKKVKLIDAIYKLPDLQSDLLRYNLETKTVRGDIQLTRDMIKDQQQINFTFHHACSASLLRDIVNQFNSKDEVMFCYNFNEDENNGHIHTKMCKLSGLSFPDTRETLDHNLLFYKDPICYPELVDLYLISYSLSMLSRYFPDIWISFIESHCKGAKLVERIVRLLLVKIPNLILNQIFDTNIIISNHRPPWK